MLGSCGLCAAAEARRGAGGRTWVCFMPLGVSMATTRGLNGWRTTLTWAPSGCEMER
jgi:hypothetical protein